MAVLRPLKVVITNYPEDQVEEFEAPNHPADPAMGTRKVPFSRELYIERDDFMEEPPKNFFRLAPGREVRLRFAYFIRCEKVIKDPETGEVLELHCTYDPATRGGSAPTGARSREHPLGFRRHASSKAQMRLYDRLFSVPNPAGEKEAAITEDLNPHSLEVLDRLPVEPSSGATPLREAATSSNGRAISVLDARPPCRGNAGVQPHRHPAGLLGQGG